MHIHYRRDYDEQKAVVVVNHHLSGLGNLWWSVAYSQGRLTFIFEHDFVRLTIQGGLQLREAYNRVNTIYTTSGV